MTNTKNVFCVSDVNLLITNLESRNIRQCKKTISLDLCVVLVWINNNLFTNTYLDDVTQDCFPDRFNEYQDINN